VNCYEATNCTNEQRSSCIVYRNFHNNAGDMENISCWVLKRGSPGWTREDEARCAECAYYAAMNRHGVSVRLGEGEDDAAVIECSGTLNAQRTATLREVADKLKAQKRGRVVLDLSAVTNIYSSAMSMIVRLHLQCEDMGGLFVMTGATGYVKVAINTVSIDRLVRSAESLEKALDMVRQNQNGGGAPVSITPF